LSTKSDETWVRSKTGASLCALMSGERGLLMHLPEPGASGATSRDPKYAGPKSAMLSFRLANGQVDVYPASWTLPRETIEKALAHFVETGERPAFVRWHDD
jgi:hypothetical protein